MKNEEMIDCLMNIEQTVDVLDMVELDIHIWPILRTMIFFENAKRNGFSNGSSNGKLKIFRSILTSLFERCFDRKHHAKIQQADYYFLTVSNSRYQIGDSENLVDEYTDTFISPLVKWLNDSYFIDELVPNEDYRLPRSEPTHYIQHIVYLNYLRSFINVHLKSFTRVMVWQTVWEQIDAFLQERHYHTDIRMIHIRKKVEQVFLLSKWFSKRLSVIKPKKIMVMCYYSTPCMALVHAAKQHNIETIDLQHGAQGSKHVAYSFSKIPETGWNILPNRFWNWTQKDVENIKLWGGNKHVGFNGGIIWHQYIQSTSCIADSWNVRLKEVNIQNMPCILVTFQPLDNVGFINSIQQMIHSDKGKKYFWLLRLHPAMIEKISEYQSLFDRNHTNLQVATLAPLPILLNKIKLHITKNSSVIIESAMYGVVSFVEKGVSFYRYYENEGLVVYYLNDLFEKFLHYDINTVKKRKKMVNSMNACRQLLK